MSRVLFIGCLHLGHDWMAKHRGFSSIYEYHEHLITEWNNNVTKNDLVFILGDITMENPSWYYLLDQLKGRKKVILGNHDRGKDIPELLKYVETVESMICYKDYWITHAPIHPQELTFVKGNIHAHIHEMIIPKTEVNVDYWDRKGVIISETNQGYINVDAQNINYIPRSIEYLEKLNKPHFINNIENEYKKSEF